MPRRREVSRIRVFPFEKNGEFDATPEGLKKALAKFLSDPPELHTLCFTLEKKDRKRKHLEISYARGKLHADWRK
jgi:hypothetical protein